VAPGQTFTPYSLLPYLAIEQEVLVLKLLLL